MRQGSITSIVFIPFLLVWFLYYISRLTDYWSSGSSSFWFLSGPRSYTWFFHVLFVRPVKVNTHQFHVFFFCNFRTIEFKFLQNNNNNNKNLFSLPTQVNHSCSKQHCWSCKYKGEMWLYVSNHVNNCQIITFLGGGAFLFSCNLISVNLLLSILNIYTFDVHFLSFHFIFFGVKYCRRNIGARWVKKHRFKNVS